MIEMLVVVAVMGFALSLVITRGPVHSQSLDMKAAVNEVAQGLRLARSRAIATNTPVQFAVDVPLRTFRIDRGTPTILPASMSIAMTAVAEETLGARLAAIRFNGDGSATGGRIELTDGQRRSQIGVDWLTGRVSVLQVR